MTNPPQTNATSFVCPYGGCTTAKCRLRRVRRRGYLRRVEFPPEGMSFKETKRFRDMEELRRVLY